jgi:hypothetical protein
VRDALASARTKIERTAIGTSLECCAIVTLRPAEWVPGW